jgi:hypothetical protein
LSLLLERRIAPRRNTNIQARIVYGGGRTVLPCIVKNTSETGAKLEVASVAAIPNTFDLLVPGHHPQSCRVVWRAMRELGVAYQAPH